MKRILMFQDYFYVGGIEKVILDIKKNIDADIEILSIVNKSDEKVISLVDKDYRKLFTRVLFGLNKYRRYLKSNQYDIIHIHCYNAFGLIYAFIAKKYCNHIILHAHNSDIDKDILYIKHIINNLIKFFFKSKKYYYMAVSDEANKFCFNVSNTTILPNAIDYHKYYFNKNEREKYRKMFGFQNNEIVIGHIGRFNEQKNHEFIIDIFNEINKLKGNYKLVLIGEGILKNRIKDKVKKLNLDNKVLFLNNRSDISKLINMFDIFLFPSLYEGFPLTVIENQVNGRYVFISSQVTKEVKISSRINFLSLSNDAFFWAREIVNLKEKKLNLDNRLDLINYINKLNIIYRSFDEKN